MSNKTLTYSQILDLAKQKKYEVYYYLIKNHKEECFGRNYKKNVANANKIIQQAKCNNSGLKFSCGFNWAYDLFYGNKHNRKLIITRPKEISKTTTRLDLEEINWIKSRFRSWFAADLEKQLPNKQKSVILSRMRIYHVFNTLINSGMRIGELCAIDFKNLHNFRIIESQIIGKSCVEIIINCEKVCKKREVYIPKDSFDFFRRDKWKLTRTMVQSGFDVFKQWSKIPFKMTCHSLRRTFATTAYGMGIDIDSISMCLGNTNKVCSEHYILSSLRNFDAFEIVNAYHESNLVKTKNMFLKEFLKIKKNTIMNSIDDRCD
ncbi:MAG: hypothetical protein Ta2E_08230 [Mycoplasmoidaceae bacterium]|nr:MAG: hypothetical protein Ta2E_08230 [Mycoplasmoidaceae bacterium]